MMLILFGLIAVFLPSISCSTCLNGNNTQSIIVEEGTSILLECYAGGETNAPIKWHREPFPNRTNQNTTLPNGEQSYSENVLELSSITRHQSGIYICSVNDQDQSVSRYFKVTVNFKPIIIETLRVDRFESKEVELRCNAKSEPPAKVRWFKNNFELRMSAYDPIQIITHRKFDDTLNSTLIESRLSSNYYADYNCVFENQLGNVNVTFGAPLEESRST